MVIPFFDLRLYFKILVVTRLVVKSYDFNQVSILTSTKGVDITAFCFGI
jgi:hypothetical protein